MMFILITYLWLSHKWAIYMYSPHIKMLETPTKDYSDWKSTQTEGKSDNVYVLGNGNWTISTAQQVHIASGIKGPSDAFAVDNTIADDKNPGALEYDLRIDNNLQKLITEWRSLILTTRPTITSISQ